MVSNAAQASRPTSKDATANAVFWNNRWESDASRLFAANLDEAEIWDFDSNGMGIINNLLSF